MADYPALPIFTDALLGDTQHLTQAEFGAYLLMLIVAWRAQDCSLPNDPRYLARITRSIRNWSAISSAVMPFWKLGEDNQLRQKRLSKERAFVTNAIEQRRQAGINSAKLKAPSLAQLEAPSLAQLRPVSTLNHNETTPTSVAAPCQRDGNENEAPTPTPKKVRDPPVAR